ncbi:MAG: acyl-CoA thioesterase [Simkaniaceae bacterium]|nr:acyl-CoA thioesterase [Simkaniaceae bacterium]
MKEKTVNQSAIDGHTYRIFSNDLNPKGTVFGGRVMSILDRLASIVAERHSEKVCVTASVDSMHFLGPAKQGENLICQVAINKAWKTSMEIGTRVLAEAPRAGKKVHILSAYFTFVALDDEDFPTKVPKVIPETTDQIRRYDEAELRRTLRFAASQEIKALRKKR